MGKKKGKKKKGPPPVDPKTICTCEACISLYDPATVRLIKATYQNAALANGLLLQGENISESERMTHCRQVMEIAMNGGPPDLKKPENRHGTPHHCTYAPERRLQRYVSMEALPAAGDAEMPSSPASSPKKGGRYDGDDDDDGGVIFDDDELGPIPIVHMPRPLPGGREGHSAVLVQSPAAPVGGVVGGAGGAIAGAGNPFTPGPGEMQTKMSLVMFGGSDGDGVLEDCWELELGVENGYTSAAAGGASATWHKMAVRGGAASTASTRTRACACAVPASSEGFEGTNVLAFGGVSKIENVVKGYKPIYRSDFVHLNYASRAWETVKVKGDRPSARAGATLTGVNPGESAGAATGGGEIPIIDIANSLSRPNSFADLPKRPPPPEPAEGTDPLTPRRVHEEEGYVEVLNTTLPKAFKPVYEVSCMPDYGTWKDIPRLATQAGGFINCASTDFLLFGGMCVKHEEGGPADSGKGGGAAPGAAAGAYSRSIEHFNDTYLCKFEPPAVGGNYDPPPPTMTVSALTCDGDLPTPRHGHVSEYLLGSDVLVVAGGEGCSGLASQEKRRSAVFTRVSEARGFATDDTVRVESSVHPPRIEFGGKIHSVDWVGSPSRKGVIFTTDMVGKVIEVDSHKPARVVVDGKLQRVLWMGDEPELDPPGAVSYPRKVVSVVEEAFGIVELEDGSRFTNPVGEPLKIISVTPPPPEAGDDGGMLGSMGHVLLADGTRFENPIEWPDMALGVLSVHTLAYGAPTEVEAASGGIRLVYTWSKAILEGLPAVPCCQAASVTLGSRLYVFGGRCSSIEESKAEVLVSLRGGGTSKGSRPQSAARTTDAGGRSSAKGVGGGAAAVTAVPDLFVSEVACWKYGRSADEIWLPVSEQRMRSEFQTWYRPDTRGVPSGRLGHSATAVGGAGGSAVVVFGGRGEGGKYLNDTVIFSGEVDPPPGMLPGKKEKKKKKKKK